MAVHKSKKLRNYIARVKYKPLSPKKIKVVAVELKCSECGKSITEAAKSVFNNKCSRCWRIKLENEFYRAM